MRAERTDWGNGHMWTLYETVGGELLRHQYTYSKPYTESSRTKKDAINQFRRYLAEHKREMLESMYGHHVYYSRRG